MSLTSKKKKAPHSTLMPFYMQSEPLLLQFILYEFLESSKLLKKLPSQELFAKLVGQFPLFADLAGVTIGSGGSLRKLAFYCNLLHQFPHKNHLEADALSEFVTTVHTSFQVALNCQRIFSSNRESFEKDYKRLKRQMKKVTELLFERLHIYRENENILLFLLKRQDDFKELFGKKALANLLNSFYANGFKEASEHVLSRYEKRGFLYLLPKIRQECQKLGSNV